MSREGRVDMQDVKGGCQTSNSDPNWGSLCLSDMGRGWKMSSIYTQSYFSQCLAEEHKAESVVLLRTEAVNQSSRTCLFRCSG